MKRIRFSHRTLYAAATVACLLFSGCEDQATVTPPVAKAKAKSKAALKPITEEEVWDFFTDMEAAVLNQDIKLLNQQFLDWGAILETATSGFEESETLSEARKGFMKGAQQNLDAPGSIAFQIVNSVAMGSHYDFLRLREVDGQWRMLFRMASSEGGLIYLDLILGRNELGGLRIVDIFDYYAGEKFSDKFRRGYLPVVQSVSRGVLDKLSGKENAYMEHVEDIKRFSELQQAGKSAEALKLFKSWPEDLQKNKNLMILRMSAAIDVSEEEYLAAIEDFRSSYPDDPCIDLAVIDSYLLRKEYDKGLAAVDRIEKAVGGDPYLNVLRAQIYLMAENYQQAKEHAQKAIAEDMTLEDANWALVDIALKEKDHEEVARLLTELEKKFAVEFEDITQLELYADFVKSEAYQQWLKRPKRPRPDFEGTDTGEAQQDESKTSVDSETEESSEVTAPQ